MQLTKRLYEIATLVPADSRVVDVGTDHGYIPIYLTYHQKASYCIASDINKGPLESAAKNIQKYLLEGICLRQGSGLSTVTEEDGMNVAIIAGMGGPLIIDILKNNLTIVKGVEQLILQPQSNIPDVRRYVHSIGFKIRSEKALVDEGKFYIILDCVKGEETYTEMYHYEYGKYLLEHPNQDFIQWLDYKKDVFQRIMNQLENAETDEQHKRYTEVEADYKLLKEALTCIL